MNISNADKMKVKELRNLIRESIKEVLKEAGVPTIVKYKSTATPDKVLNVDPSDQGSITSLKNDPNVTSVTMGPKRIKEMARIAKGYRLADDNIDTTPYANKRISGVSLADIIDYIRENPGTDKKALQTHFNFVRPQIANAVVNALQDSGVLVKLGTGGEPEIPSTDDEEPTPVTASDVEDVFVGGADPLSLYFGGEETPEEEPEAGEIEKAEPTKSTMSDEDFEAFDKYTDLKQRLDATKSNILKLKRRKGGSPGDISDKPSSELIRLRDLKKSLESRIDSLVAGSPYLQQRVGATTPPVEEPTVEPEETEEETPTTALDEYQMRKIQYYAGIIK